MSDARTTQPGTLGPTGVEVTRRRTGWDVVLGILLVLGSFVVLGDVVIATVVSILVIGWTAIVGGVALAVASFARRGGSGFWVTLLGGIALVVVGILLLADPKVGAITVTLFVGATFFAAGVTRLVMVFSQRGHRWLWALSGLASLVVGIWVLVNPIAASMTLIGVLLGIEMLFEGITLIVAGRLHVRSTGGSGPIAYA
ncbi:HdeD family acid-resistance protein [Cellulomonas composti]|uniref:Acid-resistance membrane protein n=1 Tax=Cellulomonas composti TaxID=266130 RepID=A0A511J6T8_9CELL|nr:HdeD family acid-resistance protein [Cellulomonas composti]GEL93732.1 hypothetical protein CCO02nite_03900 [Cellulomonas composti]